MNVIKQLTLYGKNWLFVPLPDDAFNFKIDRPLNEYMKYFHLSWKLSECEFSGMAFFFKYFGGRDKYPKDLVFLATTTDITEDQAGEISITYNDLAEYGITGRHAIIQIL